MTYFAYAKVGDKVTDLMWGDGEITKINGRIIVNFPEMGPGISISFYLNGRQKQYNNQTLFYRGGVEVVVKPVERMVEKTEEEVET